MAYFNVFKGAILAFCSERQKTDEMHQIFFCNGQYYRSLLKIYVAEESYIQRVIEAYVSLIFWVMTIDKFLTKNYRNTKQIHFAGVDNIGDNFINISSVKSYF